MFIEFVDDKKWYTAANLIRLKWLCYSENVCLPSSLLTATYAVNSIRHSLPCARKTKESHRMKTREDGLCIDAMVMRAYT